MGEGLKADKARDATFLITGSSTWVGKPAYLTANPMTLLEGRRTITRAILDQRVKARRLGHPRVNLPAQQPFRFDVSRTPPPRAYSPKETQMGCPLNGLPKAEAATGGGEIRNRDHPGFLPLHQIEVSRVMGV